MRAARALLVAAVLLAPAAARAGDEEQELQLFFNQKLQVSSASKSSKTEDVRDTAAVVTVVTAEEIRAFGYKTLADILQTVPECFAGGDRSYAIAGLRGFSRAGDFNTRVLLLLDGHVLNEPWNNYAPVGTDFPIDLEQVERVEVITGPVSALYGSNAFFGAINVVTKRPGARTAGGSWTSGSFGYDRAAASYGDAGPAGADGEAAWQVSTWAAGNIAAGEDLRYRSLPGAPEERGTDWDRNGAGYVRMSRGRVSIAATAFSRYKGVTGGQFASIFGDRRSWSADSHAAAEVGVRLLQGPALSLRARAYGDVYRYEDLYRYDPDPVFVDLAISEWGGAEAVGEWRAGKSSLVVSLEDALYRVSQDSYERQGTGTTPPDPTQPPNDVPADVRSFQIARASAHETFQLGSRVRLVGGAYAESHSLYGLAIAPRAGIVARPTDRTTVKALYGRGFRSPSILERYFDDGDTQTGNPDLKAETVDGLELAARQTLGRHVELFGDAFDGEYHDLIVQVAGVDVDPGPGVDLRQQYQNQQRVRASGVTGGMMLRSHGSSLRLDATGFQHRILDGGGAPVQGSPEWLAHLVAIAPVAPQASIAGRLAAVGARPGRDGRRLAPYVLVDAAVRVDRLWKGLGLSASVTNALDGRYEQPAGDEYAMPSMPMPRRRFFLEASWLK